MFSHALKIAEIDGKSIFLLSCMLLYVGRLLGYRSNLGQQKRPHAWPVTIFQNIFYKKIPKKKKTSRHYEEIFAQGASRRRRPVLLWLVAGSVAI
jgi:hypothetical protein